MPPPRTTCRGELKLVIETQAHLASFCCKTSGGTSTAIMAPGSTLWARGLVHAPGPLADDPETVFPGKDPGQAQGDDLTHAVSGQGCGFDPEGEQLAGHGILQSEQGRLLPAGLLQILLSGGEHQFQEVGVGLGGEALHPLADQGKSPVKVLAHPRIMGALSSEDQGQRRGRVPSSEAAKTLWTARARSVLSVRGPVRGARAASFSRAALSSAATTPSRWGRPAS